MKCPDYLDRYILFEENRYIILRVIIVILNYGIMNVICDVIMEEHASRAALYVGLHAAQDGAGSKVITMATKCFTILCSSEGK